MIYSNVKLTFLSADEVMAEYVATIRRSDSEMIIDIPADQGPDQGPYLVRGRLVNSFYAGQDEVTDAQPVDIVARWAELGDVWVGWWCEEGSEYLFTFRLPRHSSETKSARKSRSR